MTAVILAIAGALLSLISFVVGKTVSETEKTFSEKRRVYEEFLRACPMANDAYASDFESFQSRSDKMMRLVPVLSLYASAEVVLAVGEYLQKLDSANSALAGQPLLLQDEYKIAAKAHNDVVLEMRRDALAWSFFGYRGPSRLPPDAVERARRNSV